MSKMPSQYERILPCTGGGKFVTEDWREETVGFKERFAEGRRDVAKKIELKALRKAPKTAEWVTIKVVGTS